MKLLMCDFCGDVFNLSQSVKSCSCGNTKGQYTDNINAWYSGGLPLCFANDSLVAAIGKQKTTDEKYPDTFYGERFESWVCPANSKSFVSLGSF